MPSTPESLVAKAAREEGERAARMATPWALCWQEADAQSAAVALCWMGRHLSEMFWQFEVASEVDRLGAELTTAMEIDRNAMEGEVGTRAHYWP